MQLHKLLRKDLAALELRGALRWSNNRQTPFREFVGNSEHQGLFGPDYREIRLELRRDVRHVRNIGQICRDALRHLRDPIAPWGAPDVLHLRALPQLPYKRMFARAAADDQNLHVRELGKHDKTRVAECQRWLLYFSYRRKSRHNAFCRTCTGTTF